MTYTTPHDQLNEKELAILHAVKDGNDDTLKIRKATTLDNRQINHHLVEKNDNLEELGLVNISRPDGPERREENGHVQYLPYAPKRVALTGEGRTVLREAGDVENYADMTKKEMVRRMRELEERVEDVETRFDVFRRQVRERLEELE